MSKEKIEAFWKDATAEDVVRVMAGKAVKARFREFETDPWCTSRDLTGCRCVGDGKLRWFTLTSSWRYCQVYREPSWYAERPDPGPGWRLLGKFPDEEPLLGDSVFCTDSKRWMKLDGGFDPGQRPGLWYRRRIEPVGPKFAVGQTVRVVGPKVKPARNWTAAMDEHIEQVYTVVSVQNYPGHPSGTADFYSVKGVVDWAFREDYLEAVKTVEMVAYQAEIGEVIEFPCGIKLAATSKGFEVTQ